MVIALDELWVFCNFGRKEMIVNNLLEYWIVIEKVIGEDLFEEYKKESDDEKGKGLLREMVHWLFNVEEVKNIVEEMMDGIKGKDKKGGRDELMIELDGQYTNDIGLLF